MPQMIKISDYYINLDQVSHVRERESDVIIFFGGQDKRVRLHGKEAERLVRWLADNAEDLD